MIYQRKIPLKINKHILVLLCLDLETYCKCEVGGCNMELNITFLKCIGMYIQNDKEWRISLGIVLSCCLLANDMMHIIFLFLVLTTYLNLNKFPE